MIHDDFCWRNDESTAIRFLVARAAVEHGNFVCANVDTADLGNKLKNYRFRQLGRAQHAVCIGWWWIDLGFEHGRLIWHVAYTRGGSIRQECRLRFARVVRVGWYCSYGKTGRMPGCNVKRRG
jgi:hypothetical protein